jgi:hypothetical protein
MEDPDVCLQQLEAARTSIANTAKVNEDIIATRARYKKESDDANAVYLQKKTEYENAVNTYNNYLVNDRSYETREGSAGCWTHTRCHDDCGSNQHRYPEGGAGWSHSFSGGCCCSEKCWCQFPNPTTVRNYYNDRNAKKATMDSAYQDWLAKKKTHDDYLPDWAVAPINIACCSNKVTCAPGADCADITQTCEAKISTLKEEKAAKEAADKEAADAKEAADKEAAAKEAAAKEAAAKEAAAKKATADKAIVEQKKTNSIGSTGSTDSSSNTIPIIGGGVLSCCCFCIIIILIVIILMK